MNKIMISEIHITPIKPQKSLVGFASCVINNQIYLGSIAIHCDITNNSFRCVYPTKKFKEGRELPIFYPINKETGQAIQNAVIAEWEFVIHTVCS